MSCLCGEIKVHRVLPSGSRVPRIQGWLNFTEIMLATVRKSLHRSCRQDGRRTAGLRIAVGSRSSLPTAPKAGWTDGWNLLVKEFWYLRTVNVTDAVWSLLPSLLRPSGRKWVPAKRGTNDHRSRNMNIPKIRYINHNIIILISSYPFISLINCPWLLFHGIILLDIFLIWPKLREFQRVPQN